MKIQNLHQINSNTSLFTKKQQSESVTNSISSPNRELSSKELSSSLRATTLGGIAFTGEIAVKEKNQTYIDNLFSRTLKSSHIEANKPNPAFDIEVNRDGSTKEVKIYTNGLEQSTFSLKSIESPDTILPKATFKIGKFDPVIDFVDEELGIKVNTLAGSKIKADNFELVYPGTIRTEGRFDKKIAFTGNGELQVVTYYKEQASKDAVDMYKDGNFHEKIQKGDYVKLMEKMKPTFMVLAGGFGTRLYDYTGAEENKPSAKILGDDRYRLMGNAIDLASKAGVIDGNKDKIKYLSGAGSIQGDDVEDVLQNVNLGDGGCIAKSLALGKTDVTKPLVVLNADTVTNADITRALKEFNDHPDAAILIPYYESPRSRAKEFGLMAAYEVQGQNVSIIRNFVEKPKDLKDAEDARINGTTSYMANPGIYIISPEALQILKKQGEELIEKGGFELGLAKDFITPIVEKCGNNGLRRAGGNNEFMKAYTVPLERKGGGAAYWDDLGKTGAIVECFREMAHQAERHDIDSPENKFYGLPEFLLKAAKRNVDLETGVVCMTDKAREKLERFKEKYGIEKLEGNIIVSDIEG